MIEEERACGPCWAALRRVDCLPEGHSPLELAVEAGDLPERHLFHNLLALIQHQQRILKMLSGQKTLEHAIKCDSMLCVLNTDHL